LYFVNGKSYEHSLIIYWTALVPLSISNHWTNDFPSCSLPLHREPRRASRPQSGSSSTRRSHRNSTHPSPPRRRWPFTRSLAQRCASAARFTAWTTETCGVRSASGKRHALASSTNVRSGRRQFFKHTVYKEKKRHAFASATNRRSERMSLIKHTV